MAQARRPQEPVEQYAQVVTQAWQDEGFKQRLVANPRAVLQDHGLPVPADKTVRVVEETADSAYLVLPARPNGEQSAARLTQAAGARQNPARQYMQVVTRAWQDEGFKQRLLGDPRAALLEQGLPLPAGKTVRVVENTADTVHLVLPRKPADGELSDEQLEQVSGGLLLALGYGLIGAGIGFAVGALLADGAFGDLIDTISGWFD